jgi:hypothetical protein
MSELELIIVTQYAFAMLGKGLPKGCVLKRCEDSDHVVEFYKYDEGHLLGSTIRPVGFYFKDGHRYELRSKYDGEELIGFSGEELDNVIDCLFD